MSNIEKRSEILFLYDVTYANPNGDPNDENKPRIDEESGLNIVTDVRLKRTVRDYLHDFKKVEISIKILIKSFLGRENSGTRFFTEKCGFKREKLQGTAAVH